MTKLVDNWVQRLAFEVALGYYAPEDLCLEFELTPGRLELIRQHRDFQKAVQSYRREIDDEGISFRLRARRSAEASLDVLTEIAFSPTEDASDRLRAVELLNRLAGTDKTAAAAEQGPRLIIQTNLSLNGADSGRGVYTVEATGVAPEQPPALPAT